jgi:DNA-binding IclR family transcriptional regulator
MTQRRTSSSVAVERAVDVLFVIAEHGQVTVSDLARSLGSSGSTVHRILMALKKKGLVHQTSENGSYALSASTFALTIPANRRSDPRSVSAPFMEQLRDLTEETITLSARLGFERVYIHQTEGPHEIRRIAEIGRVSPLYVGATGKAILAHLEPHELDRYFEVTQLTQLTPFTIIERDQLLKELDGVRKRGYCIASDDNQLGVAGVSAPIFDANGHAGAALTIGGPSDRCTPESLIEWVEPLLDAAREISTRLGS